MHPRIQKEVDGYFRTMGKFWGWFTIIFVALAAVSMFVPKSNDPYKEGEHAAYMECEGLKAARANPSLTNNYDGARFDTKNKEEKWDASSPKDGSAFRQGYLAYMQKHPGC